MRSFPDGMHRKRRRAVGGLLGLSVSLAMAGCASSPSTQSGEAGRGGNGGTVSTTTGASGQGGGGATSSSGMAGSSSGAAGTSSGTAAVGGTGGAAPGGTGGSSGATSGGGGTGNNAGGAGAAGGSRGGVGGAAGGSAGAGGTGTGGASACVGLLCEDFETGSIDPAKWDTSTKGGTLEVQTQQVAHGKYALHLQALASGSDDWATLFLKTVPAALKGATTFGRASMYFSAGVSASLHIQFPFAGSTGTGSGTGPAPLTKLRYLEVGSYNGQWQLSMDIHDASPTIEDSTYAGSKIPTDKWVCIEWELEDQPERITLWVGGTQTGVFDNMHINYSSDGLKSGGTFYQGKTSGLIGAFDTFAIGFHDWHPTKAFDVYYDDVVLDSKKIGCPAAP